MIRITEDMPISPPVEWSWNGGTCIHEPYEDENTANPLYEECDICDEQGLCIRECDIWNEKMNDEMMQ